MTDTLLISISDLCQSMKNLPNEMNFNFLENRINSVDQSITKNDDKTVRDGYMMPLQSSLNLVLIEENGTYISESCI